MYSFFLHNSESIDPSSSNIVTFLDYLGFRLKTRVWNLLPEYLGNDLDYFWDTYRCSMETFDSFLESYKSEEK